MGVVHSTNKREYTLGVLIYESVALRRCYVKANPAIWGRFTHHLACHSDKIMDLASLQTLGGSRRAFTGPGSLVFRATACAKEQATSTRHFRQKIPLLT